MKFLNHVFFYSYIGLVILAGSWGAFFNANLDFEFLFHLNTHELPTHTRINLLSQYRFLRALELGFGIFSILFFKEIFSIKKYNRLFLAIMGLGILARVASWIMDGPPSGLFKFFLTYEAVGWIIIYMYSRKLGIYHAID